MYSYGLLETECYYLVQEKENSPVQLIKVSLESDHCMFVMRYDDPMETEWKKKTDRQLEELRGIIRRLEYPIKARLGVDIRLDR